MGRNLFKLSVRVEWKYFGAGAFFESWNRLHLVLGPARFTVAIWSY